ncbi:serine hydrolase domain-containing protein [Erythrobacter sp. GH1-10]|uniref:serine hydrolase domain-containing protein n=1 Tax=Erythrobacter sp. GH1-10 TaxID=3349334 RepID=UPI003877E83B
MKRTLIAFAIAFLPAASLPSAAFAQSPDGGSEQAQIETAIVPIVTFEGEEGNRKTLEQRRTELGVPAVSTAVLRNGELSWARAYGEGADEDTLFQFASLSKPVAAAGIIALAFERGVGLDHDISPQLTGLDLERLNPDGIPITLRGILSQTSGATVGGFPGYISTDPVPTTAEVIGVGGPTNTPPVVIEPNPDGERRYSGGGYTIAQYWAEQVSGESFESVMRRLILDPLGMERSTFASAPPAGFTRENVASGWGNDGEMLRGQWRIHPEQAAASLWSTPREFSRFLSALMAALDGEASGGITPEVAKAMATPVSETYGLGLGIADIDGAIRLTHSGSNLGYKSNFMAYPATGDAIVTVVNSEKGWPLVGDIGRTANVTYGWPMSSLLVRQRMDASEKELSAYVGDYVAESGPAVFTLVADAPELLGSAPSGYTFRLVKTGEATFIDPEDGQEGTFVIDDTGRMSVTFAGTTFVREREGD